MNNIKEMISVVQMYIHHRKGVEVQISIRNTIDIFKLTQAYDIAVNWLNENNFKIIK
jgi:hypothetical protein